DRLPARDHEFALSLLSAPHPSPNSCIGSRSSPIATQPATTTEPTKPLAGFIMIYRMMHPASEKLRHPKVLARAGDTNMRLRRKIDNPCTAGGHRAADRPFHGRHPAHLAERPSATSRPFIMPNSPLNL